MSALRVSARACGLAIASTVALSCSNLATIERRSGPTLEARIDTSDSERLYVTDAEDARYMVDRSDIVEIQHPGRPGIATGAILLGAGAVAFAVSPLIARAENKNSLPLDLIAVAYGVSFVIAGIPPLFYGIGVNMRSHEAAKARPRMSTTQAQELPRLPCPSCR